MTGELVTPHLRGLMAATPALGTRFMAVPRRSPAPVHHFLEPVADAATMRTLAKAAIDAAMHAGAEWADIRLGDQRTYGGHPASVTYSFGLRVRVGGVEAFVGGGDPTTDRLARAAQSAVATARGLARAPDANATPNPAAAASHVTLVTAALHTTGDKGALPPVPVVMGEWRAPIETDPFAISIDEHDHVNQTLNGLEDVRLAGMHVRRYVDYMFRAETRVNASSDGSLLTQYLSDVIIRGNVVRGGNWRMRGPGEELILSFPGGSCTGGFEVIARLHRFDQLEQMAQELHRYEVMPGGMIDVGRYNVVFDGAAHAGLVQAAMVPALSLRRALGYDADISGTSPLRPINEVVQRQIFSPALSLRVEHAPPAFGACRWDAEGVAATSGPLITNGTVVNYITTRATHAILATRLSGDVPSLLGCAVATRASDPPTEVPASLSVPAAATGGTLDELARQMGTGLVVRGGYTVVNPDGTGGRTVSPMMMFEVKGGQLVRRLYGASLQFGTKKLFKSLKALGNASTLGENTRQTYMGLPPRRMETSVAAPAALYTGIDVLNH